MAARIETAYRDALEGMLPEDKHYAFLSRHLRELQTQIQLDYLDFDKFPRTEKEVKEELARQANKYLEFGLNKHPKVKQGKGKFKDSFVALSRSQPESFSARLDIPVVALGQVVAKDVYEAAGVDYFIDGLNVRDWEEDPGGWLTPDRAYLVWMQDGAANLNKTVEAVRSSLESDTRGATELDGSGLYVAHPRILTHHFLDFPGTSVERDHAPDLYLFSVGPGVRCGLVGYAFPEFGSALCGRDPQI